MTDKKKSPCNAGQKCSEKNYLTDTLGVLLERTSCRLFLKKKITKKTADAIIEAGTKSATGGNLQPYSIIKVQSIETIEKVAELCEQKFLAGAPMHLLFCIDWRRNMRWADLERAPFAANRSFRHFWISFQDTIICAQNICTAADSLGLGSVYIGTVIDCLPKIKKIFALPYGVMPVVLLALGYPKIKPAPRKKLGLDMIVHDEKYCDVEDVKLLSAFNKKYEGLKVQITAQNVKEMYKVSKNVEGEKFAQKVVKRIKEAGYINYAQRYFGLHYPADMMCDSNKKLLGDIEKFGFGWFKEFKKK